MVVFDETCIMVRTLLGEEAYTRLIGLLPDDYFKLLNFQKRIVFKNILHEVNEGETDLNKLAETARNFTRVILEGSKIPA
ncbi:MAG: hypothetical protein A2029_01455 [Chloroflexi bacterium RBG_19FT_COMBO_47_9]|nr:MAG: hypothetical protein A2W25_05010 [candidate division Zixibacteria bacterium RBG_16_53_22]OGO66573.1 MAG: hypothetical protein A2029_01455 [Chloroflexi bacterium RBG_19FT_COMBO_47_9]